jgi:hypothetical protein
VARHAHLQFTGLSAADIGLVDSSAYLIMVTWWAKAAWQREPALDHLSPAVRRIYQFEATS